MAAARPLGPEPTTIARSLPPGAEAMRRARGRPISERARSHSWHKVLPLERVQQSQRFPRERRRVAALRLSRGIRAQEREEVADTGVERIDAEGLVDLACDVRAIEVARRWQ